MELIFGRWSMGWARHREWGWNNMDRKLDWRRDGYLKRIRSLWDEHQGQEVGLQQQLEERSGCGGLKSGHIMKVGMAMVRVSSCLDTH
jgi:hypothetical protein